MFRVSSFSDIAGQITAGSANADLVTACTVYLPTGGLKTIRQCLPPNLPKWRDANDDQVKLVLDVVGKEALGVGVGSIDKTTGEWTKFWNDSAAAHSKAASIVGGKVGHMKAANLIKFILFGYGAAAGLGRAIVAKHIPRPKAKGAVLNILEDVFLDDEIQGTDNRQALAELWEISNRHQPLINSLAITRQTSPPRLTTEQDEPLLLLSDYVAGAMQAKASRANVLQKSQVTQQALESALAGLVSSGRVNDFTGTVRLDYFSIYAEFRHLVQPNAV